MYLRTIKDIVNLLRQIQVNPRLKNLGFDQRGFFHLIVLVQLPCLVLIGKHDCTTAKKASRDIAYSSHIPYVLNSEQLGCFMLPFAVVSKKNIAFRQIWIMN